MHITVIHNPTSGFAQLSKDELLSRLRNQGYQAVYRSSKTDDLSQVLQDPGSLVVVAGGDGTVGKVAKHLVGRGVPIGLLSLGTANNIARTLAGFGYASQQITAWDSSQRKPYDVGLVQGIWGEMMFLEAVGFGIFAKLITVMDNDKNKRQRTSSGREDELHDVLVTLCEILSQYKAYDCSVMLDGVDYSGQYLAVEVMNIRSIGPNVDLAPQADPGDGMFDVVFISENDREGLNTYINKRLRGEAATLKTTVRRAKRITIALTGRLQAHIDDEIVSTDSSAALDVTLNPSALEFL
jgi:diacylglycerol kinase (ATP)